MIVKVFKESRGHEFDADLEELRGLVETAGGKIIDVVAQKRHSVDPAFYIGKGKAYEIGIDYKDTVDLIVFDADLKPLQVKNLEEATNKRIIDRAQVILDIFARRARTNEGKLQVEFAQLNYLLPRLTGHGVEMSRLGGGIGTKGPGETKLESDRRKIKKRIQRIGLELKKVKEIRAGQRERRKSVPVPLISIVGYTNVGKTMLLNTLTNAGMLSEDKLFATLDPKIKQYVLPNRLKVLFSDTVGFIKQLPPYLVAAFRATLEEVIEADIILHVIDISNAEYQKQKETVYDILKEIGAYENKIILEVYNKLDKVDKDKQMLYHNKRNSFYISAATGEGLKALIKGIEETLSIGLKEKEIQIPFDKKNLLNIFFNEGVVLSEAYTGEGVTARVRCMQKTYEKYLKNIQSG